MKNTTTSAILSPSDKILLAREARAWRNACLLAGVIPEDGYASIRGDIKAGTVCQFECIDSGWRHDGSGIAVISSTEWTVEFLPSGRVKSFAWVEETHDETSPNFGEIRKGGGA